MTLPHPKSGENEHGNEEISDRSGVIVNLIKRTINVAEYRNATDKVSPTKKRTFGGITDHMILSVENLGSGVVRVTYENAKSGRTSTAE